VAGRSCARCGWSRAATSDLSGTLVRIGGAILILAAYVGSQVGALRPDSRIYLWLNLVGAAVPTLDAWRGAQWGFMLLEGAWAGVSAWALLTRRPG
jgi:hypothetical protein